VTPRHVVLTTLGSLGDLHPTMAVALALRARGHRATLVTHGMYKEKVEAEGLGFALMPPDLTELGDLDATMRSAMEGPDASRTVIERFVLPWLDAAYDAIDAAARDADLLVAHPLTYALPIVAEKRGLPWASTSLQPIVQYSATDPSVWPQAPWLEPPGRKHPWLYRAFFGLAKVASRPWLKPVEALRTRAGLAPNPLHPSFEAMFSPALHLVLFSRVLGEPQPDWPRASLQCGFAFHDTDPGERTLDPALERFLDAGEPPIVFTLGSSAVFLAEDFYVDAVRAAQRLGRRAILLVGRDLVQRLPDPLPEGVAVFPYAPYSLLLPRGAATVHQGGAGTTGQALRAGRPMVVVPFAHDQPDHAARIARRGIGVTIPRARCDADTMTAALSRILGEPSFAARAAEAGAIVRAEHGAERAAEALERLLPNERPTRPPER